MSYESEVLADNPLFFFRLDETSVGSNMPDSSGNENHGEYFSDAGFGLASPIETDAGSLAIGARAGFKTAASGSDLDVRNAFSWECWVKWPGHSVVASTGFGRVGQWGVSGGNFMGTDDANLAAMVSWGGGSSSRTLTYPIPLAAQTVAAWYHLVVTRNGNVIRLYVNGVLRDEITDFDSGPIVYAAYNSADYVIGGSPANSQLFETFGTDEVALYDTALSAARVLAHYEAALSSLPLRATIVINVSVELNTDQITPSDFGFAHNYSATFGDSNIPIVEEIEYRTNVNQSEPDYQQRISARPHGPLRSFEYHISPKRGAGRMAFQGLLYHPGEFYTLPIWRDFGLTTAQANSGASSISCDTTLRDYEEFSYCGVCTDPSDPDTYQFFQILSVSDTALTLGSTIGTTIPSGSYVFPARVSSVSDDTLSIKSFAADHEDSVIRFDVIESELSTRIQTEFTPSVTHKSIEVFTLEAAKYSHLDEKAVDLTRRLQTRGRDYQYARDTASPSVFPVRFLLKTRAELSAFYGWLDARNGKLSPLWVPSKETDLIYSSHASGQVTVQSGFIARYFNDQGRRDLQILHTDGTVTNCRITNAVDNGDGTEELSITPGIPAFKAVSKISFLKFCTLAQDSIQIRHYKGGVSESSLSFKELLTSPA